jgi:HEAT repeat protein
MTGRSITLWSTVIVAAAVVLLVLITTAGRALRHHRDRSRERLRDELRPTIVAVLSDPDAPPPPDIPRRGRRHQLFEILAFDYLSKVRGESRDALVRLLVERGTVDDAERRLRRPGDVGRSAAAELLGRCGLVRSRVALESLLERGSAEVRAAGVRALGRLGDPAVVTPLLETLHIRRSVPAAIVAQAALRIGPSAIPALTQAAGDPNDSVRSTAVTVLGMQRAIDAVPTLIGVLDADVVVTVRGYAARALGQIGDPRAVDPLIRAVRADPENAGVVAAALGELGDPMAVEVLSSLVTNRSHDVATAAATSLTRCGDRGFAALRTLQTEGGPAADHAVAALARAELSRRGALGHEPEPRS